MISNTPTRNRTFPNASSARSKNVNTPNVKKRNPPNVNATPNFCDSDSHISRQYGQLVWCIVSMENLG